MGAVYLAEMEALGGKKVAVKEMELKGFSREELAQAVQQFNKEASFLANLDHPNLVPVTDFFIEGEKHYLVMAYVKGETLQQRLKRYGRPFGWEQVKEWAEPLVEVLSYLHNQNPPILFRDLKPSNIMLEESGRLRLIDFGIARTAQAGDRTSTFLQGTGTSGFSPIEQYGGGQSTDQRSDIYALGATLYYLLTGKIPPDAVARISQGKELIPPSQLQPALPKELDALLEKSLAVKQHDRHASMAEFRNQMQAITLDTEGATEDFGVLPAVGSTANTVPREAEPSAGPASIKIEMFPTAPASAKRTHSYTPWFVGFGSLALAGLTIAGVVGKFIVTGPATAATDPTPSPTSAITRAVDNEGEETPQPTTKTAEETKPEKTISAKKPPSNPQPYQYIQPLARPTKTPSAQPVATSSTASSPPTATATTSKKPSMGGAAYPKSNYPTARKPEKSAPKQQVVQTQPVASQQRPAQQAPAPPDYRQPPPPPPGAPFPPPPHPGMHTPPRHPGGGPHGDQPNNDPLNYNGGR
jgi:serine/threonine protein kinase